jgi:hypothetical protein
MQTLGCGGCLSKAGLKVGCSGGCLIAAQEDPDDPELGDSENCVAANGDGPASTKAAPHLDLRDLHPEQCTPL